MNKLIVPNKWTRVGSNGNTYTSKEISEMITRMVEVTYKLISKEYIYITMVTTEGAFLMFIKSLHGDRD